MKGFKIEIEPWQDKYLRANANEKTPPELAETTGLPISFIYNFCYRNKLVFKKVDPAKHALVESERRFRMENIKRFPPAAEKKIARPPAVYTNKTPYGIANHF